jgi:hypothetical protein
MSDPQPLNSLGRFRKQSEKLVLEQYSSCEVPAGCGGVILRWRNPFAAVPLIVHCYTPVPATCFIDGKKTEVPGIDLAPGPHVVAIHIERVSLSALLMFAAARFQRFPQNATLSGPNESAVSVLSAADGTWKFTLDEPETEEWRSLSFDDRYWQPMIRVLTPRVEWQEFGGYQFHACNELKAAALGIALPSREEEPAPWWQRVFGRRPEAAADEPTGGVWVRKVFEIPLPQRKEPGS